MPTAPEDRSFHFFSSPADSPGPDEPQSTNSLRLAPPRKLPPPATVQTTEYKHTRHLPEFPLHLALLVTVGVNKARNYGSPSSGRGDDKHQSGAMSTSPRIAVLRLWPTSCARVDLGGQAQQQPPP
ncbi:hypothetical protein CORC01_04203 [Colletotrichum orchidophilum]|uniref:Uncharacterized protein n=1 Tax=Colletotrichum orchidophilum TaxID=1209926 RepID=A0A1G4BGL6_9PEZI|nr:uncharacterized protein CORC01_04203 [Colletotrichum orchidophilum]OHF00453.1 hypothetical protein CORC01_04203 [Colletotrichum orchidophilum]